MKLRDKWARWIGLIDGFEGIQDKLSELECMVLRAL